MSDLVNIDISDTGVAHVRLNRADKYNSLNSAMFNAITDAGMSLRENKQIRAVVLSGEGKGFCAGLDMMSMMSDPGGPAGEDGDRFAPKPGEIANYYQQVCYVWASLPVPVIAALHGAAYGGGFQIAMGADIRVARHDCKMSIMEIKWGLVPDMSVLATMSDVIGLSTAKELTYTGRIVEADEALRLGLINHLVDDHVAYALELAEVIASKSPDAIRAGKKLLDQSWNLAPEAAMKLEAEAQQALIGKPNQLEAVMSNMQKRAAEYKDPE